MKRTLAGAQGLLIRAIAHLIDKVCDAEGFADLRHEVLLLSLLHLRSLHLQFLDTGYVLGALQLGDQVRLLYEERL